MTVTRVNLCLRPALKNVGGPNSAWQSSGSGTLWGRSTSMHATLPRTTGLAGSSMVGTVRTAAAPVTAGRSYVASVSLRAIAACSGTHGLVWYDQADQVLATSATSTYSAGAGVTQRLTTAALVAPVGATHCRMQITVPAASMQLTACLIEQTASTGGTYFDGDDGAWAGVNGDSASYVGTPTTGVMALTASYDDRLGRVRVFTSGASAIAGAAYVERRPAKGSTWSAVRGGTLPLTGGLSVRSADDYEYPPDVSLVYRASGILGIGGGVPISATGGVTVPELVVDAPADVFFAPPLVRAWLKFVAAPYLNRKVTIVGPLPEITRPSRNAVYEVRESPTPTIVTAGHSSRRFTLRLATFDQQETDALDESLRQGIPGFLHTPADSPLPSVYAVFGDYHRRTNRQTNHSFWEVPITEVSAPPASVFGTGATWQTVLDTYATWAELAAAARSWREVTS